MAGNLELPAVDLSSDDRASAAESIRHACVNYGFFYVTNHGIEGSLTRRVFEESGRFFELPLEEKMRLARNSSHRGYTPRYSEKLDLSSKFEGDVKESFYIGRIRGIDSQNDANQWPSKGSVPFWRETMELYYGNLLAISKRICSLIALSLNLDDHFFVKVGALDPPTAYMRLLHYPGEMAEFDSGNYGASAHSDYGLITLLATDGVPGLQICREKDKHPQLWENVRHVDQALVVNIGDLLERWTNFFFRSTLHRVLLVGKERFSVAFFLDSNPDVLVECLESCCSEENPPRFPPIRAGDYLQERLRITYSRG